MTVNGTEIAVGQRWKTRGGEEVVVVDNDGHPVYPWDLSNGGSVTDEGREWGDENDPGDLITLIQDEHGFIPWNGGECPVSDFTSVEYKMRGYDDTDVDSACSLDWEHGNNSTDIIAYRVVKQEVEPAKVNADGEQTKEVIVEATIEAKEEPKYTVDEVLQAFVSLTGRYAYATDEVATVKKYLAKTQDPDYKLYLELKAKFEKE